MTTVVSDEFVERFLLLLEAAQRVLTAATRDIAPGHTFGMTPELERLLLTARLAGECAAREL